MATFSHWPKWDTLFAILAWISLWHLLEARASKKVVLSVRCSRYVTFIGSKGALVSSFRTMERFLFGYISKTLGSVRINVGDQPVQRRALRNLEPCLAQEVNSSSPIGINGQ